MVLSIYELVWRPAGTLAQRQDAQAGHDRMLRLLRLADRSMALEALARLAHRLAYPSQPLSVGGAELPHPVILAAGLVKGDGFGDEREATAACARGRNIIPGWRTMPALVGVAEFGSFTRHPRMGNPGRVLWRDGTTRSLQNRVGLRNPGARAAAAHLSAHRDRLPERWGLSLAVSPGVDDLDRAVAEIEEAAGIFEASLASAARGPAWYTLNLSCPNTEDDPQGRQAASQASRHVSALVRTVTPPVWVKIGPDLGPGQLERLVGACLEAGARAIVATNTLPAPSPGGGPRAGISGGSLRRMALRTVESLRAGIERLGGGLDLVASGGILSGEDLRAFQAAGARAAMVYSALVFRGPLAGALILREAARRG